MFNPEYSGKEEYRLGQIIRTGIVGIVVNVLLSAFKFVVGILAGSVSIVLDAVNNMSDVLSSVITIIGAKLSSRPADRKHPYGHGRVEYFSTIVISVIILATGIISLIESIKKIIEPVKPEYSTVTLVVIIAAIVVKLLLGRYVKRRGERLESDALVAAGFDALFDAIVTLATLVSAGIMLMWNISIDGILGALISVVIIKAGIEMLASPVNELLGASLSKELIQDIKKEVMAFEEVHGVFDIILHNYGPNVLIGSLQISVNDTMNAYRVHGLTREISEQIYRNHGIVMTIGVYAVATGVNKRAELQEVVTRVLGSHKDVVQVHGFYYYENENRVSVDVVPDISVRDKGAFSQQLMAEVQALLPDVGISIAIDYNYSE